MAVVDGELRVHGLDGPRVINASVMQLHWPPRRLRSLVRELVA